MTTPLNPLKTDPQRSRESGFAIVIALSILAFTLLLLLSLTAFIRVEQSGAENSINQLTARQNALLGMQIAMGELQKKTGPDQRVTASADIQLPDPGDVAIDGTTGGSDAQAELNAYWHDRRNRHWSGVWRDPNPTKSDFNPDDPSDSNPEPEFEGWLVSQVAGAELGPATQIAGLAPDSTPTGSFSAQVNGEEITLSMLVSPNRDSSLTAEQVLARVVTAPAVPVQENSNTGNFAWWVDDEATKAQINLRDPYAATSSPAEEIYRLQSAQRTALEAMTGASAAGGSFRDLSAFDEVNDPKLDTFFHTDQMAFLNTLDEERLRESYHDVTTFSFGVLCDVKNGGLKYDLSRILSANSRADFQEMIGEIFDVPMDPNYNLILDLEFTPYATVPSDPSGVSSKGSYDWGGENRFMEYGPTWEQLYSHYNLKNPRNVGGDTAGVFESGGVVAFREPSSTDQGIFPIITHLKVFYELNVVGGNVSVHSIPLVVLANPYNVDITGSAEIIPTTIKVELFFSDSDDMKNGTFQKVDGVGRAYTNGVKLVVKDITIPAGEAQIFMLSGDVTDAPGNQEEAVMVNDFLDPTSSRIITDTGRNLADVEINGAPAAYASLEASGGMGVLLRIIEGSSSGTQHLTRFNGKDPWPSNIEGINKSEFVVYPTNAGLRRGAGVMLTRQDPLAQALPEQKVQQSLFYQVNPRAYATGPVGITAIDHIYSPGKTYIRPGDPSNADRFEDHLMLGSEVDNFTQVRWGIVNNGEITNPTIAPAPLDSMPVAKLFLYDLPREDHPITSLGQLQHFNMSGRPTSNPKEWNNLHAYQVNYPSSNSYPHPRVKRDMTFWTANETGPHWDASYMMNQILWDRFYFSSFPDSGNFDFTTNHLINSRLVPFRPTDEVALDDPENFRGSGSGGLDDALRASENLMVEGAFNVNSTSVEAWKAILSSLRNVPIGSETNSANLTAPYSRTLFPEGATSGAQDPTQPNAWEGFVNLSQDQIDQIAEELALEVMKRGPFLSMADFVNRTLIAAEEDTFDLGLSGALQSAIDKVVNQRSSISGPYQEQSADPTGFGQLADEEYLMPSILSGFPGYLLQGDVLSPLGPSLTARSDTFRIRTYGDAVNPLTGETKAQAWCEVLVQRYPDYIDPSQNDSADLPTGINEQFGRRYKVLSFRWLNVEDV